jgi:hypothetical protein
MDTQSVYSAAVDIIQPVLEESMVLSGQYAKACGRNVILSKDMEYCMKYCAMNSVGKKIGTHFPDLYDSDDSDESDIEVVDESDMTFEPYSGDEQIYKDINAAYELWDDWKPSNPSEKILKNAIDSNEHITASGVDDF